MAKKATQSAGWLDQEIKSAVQEVMNWPEGMRRYSANSSAMAKSARANTYGSSGTTNTNSATKKRAKSPT